MAILISLSLTIIIESSQVFMINSPVMAQSSNHSMVLCILQRNHEAYKYPLVVILTHLPSSNIGSTSDDASYPFVVSLKCVNWTAEEAGDVGVTSVRFSSSIKPNVAIFDRYKLLPTIDYFVKVTIFLNVCNLSIQVFRPQRIFLSLTKSAPFLTTQVSLNSSLSYFFLDRSDCCSYM